MATRSARLWVVDDDRTVRIVLAQALRDAGYAVGAFEGAREALAALDDGETPANLATIRVQSGLPRGSEKMSDGQRGGE